MPYGHNYWFLLCAPDGWTLNNSIGKEQGIQAVFYPTGSSWTAAQQSGTFMYYTASDKKDENATVPRVMADDADKVKREVQSAVVKIGEPIKVGGLAVPVQLFVPGGFSRFETVAYIDSPKVIIMFVMTSENEAAFKRDYEAFVHLVQSYEFMGTEVTVEKK